VENRTPAENSLTVFGTATFANSDFYAQASGRHLFLLGVQYTRALASNNFLTFDYTPEVIPLSVLLQPHLGALLISPGQQPISSVQNAYGTGLSPIAFQFLFRPQKRIQPLIATSEGFLYFSRNVPSIVAAQFNFTAAARVGFNVRLNNDKRLSFAYVFHHFSNAFEARDNPGTDSQMLYIGYIFPFSRKVQ